jgi:chromosome segregation ATPase
MAELKTRVRRKLRRLRRSREVDVRVAALTKQLAAADARNQKLAKQLEAATSRLDKHSITAERHARKIESLERNVAAMKERSRPFEMSAKYREVEHGRMTVNLAAVEQRLGALEQHASDAPLAPGDGAEARSLLDAVRREHEQIRVRMQIIAQYEERLRRVEAAIEGLDEADVRRMV